MVLWHSIQMIVDRVKTDADPTPFPGGVVQTNFPAKASLRMFFVPDGLGNQPGIVGDQGGNEVVDVNFTSSLHQAGLSLRINFRLG